jgi:anthranilate 1,2-dioxygenase ferredoxin component
MPPEFDDPDAFVPLCGANDLVDGDRQTFDVNGTRILLIRTDDRFHAVSALCSHASLELGGGEVQGGAIRCPFHGVRFDLATGRCLTGGGLRSIEVFPVIVIEGWVCVGMG